MADMGDKTDPFSLNPSTVMLNFLNQQFGTKSSLQHMLLQNGSEMHFPASESQHTSNDANKSFNFSRKEPSLSTEEKSSSRRSLSQRIAKAGLSAPTINTAQINSANIASTMDNLSSYLTISPGLPPSAFLESPVLLSNSLAQLSPTTGKFSLPRSAGNSLPTSTSDTMSTVVEKCKEECLEEIMPDRFSFQPPLGTSPSYYSSLETKFQISSPAENTVENVPNNYKEPSYTKDHVTDISENPSPLEAESIGEEDGYNWRKYGQKQVKGSEYPRSYYKCTHPTCPVKKKVERAHEGYITEIVYNGEHNHDMPVKKFRSGNPHFQQCYNKIDTGIIYGESNLVEFGDHFDSTRNQDAVNISSSTSIDDLEDGETHASVLNEGGDEGDDESKRRNLDACAVETNIGSRGAREPRVVVQTISEVDILDDGYRWRKYGQKVVKGNPNPRSYYKCTSAGCTVRKHIERASNDLKSVITTYEGKHNHEVPAVKNSIKHSTAYNPQTLNQRHPDPLMGFGSPPFLNSFSLPCFNYGVGPLDLSNIGIGSIGQMSQFNVPVLDSNYYSASVGDDGAFLPKEEMCTDDAYEQQLMSRRHNLGPQM